MEQIQAALQQGKVKLVKELVQQALDSGKTAADIMDNGLLAAMNVVGEKFKLGQAFIPEVLIAARALNGGMEVLKPVLVADDVKPKGKAVLGTVKGDLHDIGKNIVKIMFESKGIEVIDLGVDVPPEKFIAEAIDKNADIIACSALLTTTMSVMKDVVDCAVKAGIREKVCIMVGGAPITEKFCESVGADVYTADAATASDWAAKYLQQ